MPFCSKFMAAIRKVMDQIGPKLGSIIDEITKVTKVIKDIAGSPEIGALINLIPKGSEVQKWLMVALEEVSGITTGTEDFYDNLKKWLDTLPTDAARSRMLFALASEATKAADVAEGNPVKKNKVYDTAVLARIVADTPSEKLQPEGEA